MIALKDQQVALAALLVFVAALGLGPHLAFSWQVGAPTFFKGAFDEDTYLLFLQADPLMLSRLLSSICMQVLLAVSGGAPDAVLIAADVIFPVLTAASAWFLAKTIFPHPLARLLLCLALLFGGDFLSLADGAVWDGSSLSLAWFRGLFGGYGRVLVPASDTSYLTLFRTPEPQIVYAFVFVALGAAMRLLDAGEANLNVRRPHWLAALLVASAVASALGYIFVSLPLVLLLAGMTLVANLLGRGWVAGVCATASLLAGGVIAWGAATAPAGANLIFASRWPIITPAVLISALLSLVLFVAAVTRSPRDLRVWLAVGLAAMPLALTNQQLLTGLMVSARDWERYANYPLLVLGAALGWRLFISLRMPNRAAWNWGAGLGLGGLALWFIISIIGAQQTSYTLWLPQNLEAEAGARAVMRAAASLPGEPRLLYDSPGLAPHVAVRTRGVGTPILDYTDLFRDPIPLMDASGAPPPAPRHHNALFEYWTRMGITPARANEILLGEAAQQSGFFSAFLFSFADHWYPATDSRRVQGTAISAAIPGIIAEYERFLSFWNPDAAGPRPLLFIGKQAPSELELGDAWQLESVATGQAGDVVMRAYIQHWRGSDLANPAP